MKRTYLYAIIMSLFLVGVIGFWVSEFMGSTVEPKIVWQVVSVSAKERTIMWATKEQERQPKVEYRKKNGPVLQVQGKEQPHHLPLFVYAGTLKNLQEGQLYEYRVGDGQKWSSWYTLKVSKQKDTFEALLFPDSQSSDYSSWSQLAHDAWKGHHTSQLFIMMGDLVDNGYDLSQWTAWFQGVTPMISQIPIVPVMGNHETYTLDWKVGKPIGYNQFFSLPEEEGHGKKGYYAIEYGLVRFLVLNSQTEELAAFYPNLEEEQYRWLEAQLQQERTPWTIVLLHKDILKYKKTAEQDSEIPEFTDLGKRYMPLFERYHVDVVFTAHLHTYRRRGPIEGFEKSNHGPIYILTGVAGDVRYPNLWRRNSFDVSNRLEKEEGNYLYLKADAHQLSLKAYDRAGLVIDEIQIEK